MSLILISWPAAKIGFQFGADVCDLWAPPFLSGQSGPSRGQYRTAPHERTDSHVRIRIHWGPHEVQMQSGSAPAIRPLGASVKCSSAPTSQRHHIVRATAALALSSIHAGDLRAKEEPEGINYAGRKLLVGRIAVGRNPHLLDHCALATAGFPGFPASLSLRS